MDTIDTLIIGAGQAGLAAARTARHAGLSPVVVEAEAQPAGSWPRYYDSLTLFSPARFSSLPGMPFPGDPDHYPHRDEVVDYLRTYAAALDADIHTNTLVTRVTTNATGGPHGGASHDGARFSAHLADGTTLAARTVIATSGAFGTPHRPELPGLSDFHGTVLHAAHYRNPQPFAGARVVIVGGGNSAVQIAAELAEVATVTLATRSPIRFAPQRPLGRDIHWWVVRSGLDALPLRRWLEGRTSAVSDDGRYRQALAADRPDRPDRRGLFTHLTPTGVTWPDDTHEPVDVLLLATGYRPRLDFLAGTAALDPTGLPHHHNGLSTTVPGLAYVGLEYQRSFGSNTLRGVGRDARHVLRHLRGPATNADRARHRTPAQTARP